MHDFLEKLDMVLSYSPARQAAQEELIASLTAQADLLEKIRNEKNDMIQKLLAFRHFYS